MNEKLDELIQTAMQQWGIPGLNVMVRQHGKVLEQGSYGFANLEHGVPVKSETVFQIGSIGKQFAATAVMLLVEAGKIDLEAPISTYFSGVSESWSGVKVKHLLTHTAGVPTDFAGVDLRADLSEDELLEKILEGTLEFAPGDQFSYSNDGYKLVGILISKVSGMFYGDFLQQEIFQPLGMKTAQIIDDAAIIPNRASGYVHQGPDLRNQDWVSPTFNSTADGAIYMTLEDFAQWDDALREGKLLTTSSLERMWTATVLGDGRRSTYGFGWGLYETQGFRCVGHGGAWQGFTAHFFKSLNDDLSITTLTNIAEINIERIALGILGLFNPVFTPEPEPEAIADLEPEATAFAQAFLQRWATGSLEASEFTTELWDPTLNGKVGTFLAQQGSEPKLEVLARFEKDGLKVSRYRLRFAFARALLEIARNEEGKVAHLLIHPV
jgi:CubicO group peptidase (beta-lactamase class C family)